MKMKERKFIKVFQEYMAVANKKYDGHFTLLKFTTNWRFCFGTPDDLSAYFIGEMAEGQTPEEAISKGLKDNINAEQIYEMLQDEDFYE